MNSWSTLKEHLSRPEYMHVLINPLPVYGLAVAIVAVIMALAARNRVALVTALVLVLLTVCRRGRPTFTEKPLTTASRV